MEGVIHIPAGERGVIRLFTLDMRPEQAAFLKEPGALAQVLGIEALDMDQVEIFPVTDLEDIGLTGYLTEGCGVPRAQVEEDRGMLDALDGHVLLIRSRAFDGAETRLTPAEQITLVGTYGERQTNWSAPPATAESAKPYSAPKLSPRQARTQARRIGAALFAVVMLLTALLVWALMG
ncbi:hypothetical protein K3555_03325 [Leisingera sp. M527]|uniref:hypothetical protein n=1 Tax=unclassified Leisingera TaxID=2614906 RepID=UPI0021A51B5B|nr:MULTISPECIES: hypothetical protein [unclassified Leisingera]UWQ33560.1 hypothetical protein K3555_03325 [Leisingera sp. M527]UWQ75519.1 hypothetical protein K3724_03370 [Leisingera sp. M658]